jgi:hypothetical protein
MFVQDVLGITLPLRPPSPLMKAFIIGSITSREFCSFIHCSGQTAKAYFYRSWISAPKYGRIDEYITTRVYELPAAVYIYIEPGIAQI